MSRIILCLFTWPAAIISVLFIKHCLLLVLIYLPVFGMQMLEVAGSSFSEISKRSRVWMYSSLVIFMVTGIYLMTDDPNYLEGGDFGNF